MGLPWECNPQDTKGRGGNGNSNYTIKDNTQKPGQASVTVRLDQHVFYINKGHLELKESRNVAWSKHGGPAPAWKRVKEITGWVSYVT